MSAYLGTLGRLVPIYSTPTMGVSGIPARSYETTLEGRVKVQIRPVGRRSWELSAEYANPAEVGTLMGFASGEWGHGPFVWVAPTAPGANMLTPAVASCDPDVAPSDATVAGPMPLGDGSYAGRSYMPSGQFMFFGAVGDVPVLPGIPVTGSVYVLGAGAAARVNFYGSDGLRISTVTSTMTATAGSPVRSHVTAMPPANAVSALVSIENATQAARPALTWTDGLMGWAAGEGCPKAVVDAVDRTALRSSRDPNGPRYTNLSFTIREVG